MNFADPGVETKDRTLSVHGNATYMIGNKPQFSVLSSLENRKIFSVEGFHHRPLWIDLHSL